MQPKKVLIADDEPHMTYILAFKLERAGVEVVIAGDGEEAYALACEHRPDLVISDYQMPRMGGLELCRQLKANPSTTRIPVILVTARGHQIGPAELAQTNIRHVMGKPFSAIELLGRVEEVLSAAA
jgi:two-component system phosphate regulon response regulator PhoB